ncbi:hypothetical protein [Sphingobacterium sp.]|uniref:hypothetical protein n=1 Tax=Sphingobacterium sp. TaxID=341027 RepID=UPI0031E05EBF
MKFIFTLTEKLKNNRRRIVVGSDEHLDFINDRTKDLNRVIHYLAKFNDVIEKHFPNSKEDANKMLEGLHIAHSTVTLLISAVEKFNKKNSFYTCIERLKEENSQLVEYIEDINNFVLNDDDNLLADLD